VFTNPVFVWGYAKVLFAALTTGAMVMLALSAWQLRRGGDRPVFTRSARMAIIVLIPAILLTLLIGDELGVIEGKYQPMKIAAAEAQWTTCQPCSCSLFQIGGGNADLLHATEHRSVLFITHQPDGLDRVDHIVVLDRSCATPADTTSGCGTAGISRCCRGRYPGRRQSWDGGSPGPRRIGHGPRTRFTPAAPCHTMVPRGTAMAQDMPGAGATAGGTTVVIPGEMAARVDRLPMSGMAWELAPRRPGSAS
jgi:Cytochrome bd terminal oxidase subunit I